MDLFKKSSIVGVSVTPGIGLEVAEIDFGAHVVTKYGSKPLDYNINARRIADMDLFKDTLQDLFMELNISKSSRVVLNIPTVTLRVAEFPASMDEIETTNALTESLLSSQIFGNEDVCYSAARLPSSSIQFNKILYTAAQHNIISEAVASIKDLGYKVHAIDTSISSVFNALKYVGPLANVDPGTSWVMMVVDNTSTRVIPMLGYNALDVYEERISIGEVLGDSENYSTVLSTVQPILKNTPSKYLYVVSTTNVISAEILAGKLQYSAPIIHQEANRYTKEAFIDTAPSIDPDQAKQISLEVIGAAIRGVVEQEKLVNLNLYNSTLGDLYLQDQPLQFQFLGRTIVLSPENLIKTFIVLAILILAAVIPFYVYVNKNVNDSNAKKNEINREIAEIDRFIQENKEFSTEAFDEGDEIRGGIAHNKGIYSYYTIVGTEIPKKLWLTHLKLGDKVTIEGQSDNLESVYSFYRSIKDYDPASDIKLQKLGLASKSKSGINMDSADFDTESVLTSLNADFYEYRISNEPEVKQSNLNKKDGIGDLPELESLN